MDHYQRIQEIIFDYFDKTDNQTLIDIIDTFCFGLPVKNDSISKMIEKFLDDNDLMRPFLNRETDKQRKIDGAYFLRSSMSDIEIMNNVSMSLISLTYNRFRQIKPPKLIKPKVVHVIGEDEDNTHIVHPLHDGYTICGLYLDGDLFGDWKDSDDKPKCKQCLKVVKSSKQMDI